MIYTVDRVIHLSNNWGLMYYVLCQMSYVLGLVSDVWCHVSYVRRLMSDMYDIWSETSDLIR